MRSSCEANAIELLVIGRWKKLAYRLLEAPGSSGAAVRAVRLALSSLIVINIICAVLSTVPGLARFAVPFRIIELVSVTVFTVEYLLRLWVVVERDLSTTTVISG